MSDKGSQCSLTFEVLKVNQETQTGQQVYPFERLQPALVTNDGVLYQMGTDKVFKVLAKPRNGIDKQFRVLNGLVVDETS